MESATSKTIYQKRIDKAVQFINEHLTDQLCLEKVAEAAHFSPYHFHRIFSGMIGETPHDFLKRVRLEKAANMLIKMPSLSITEIAISCGFSSSSTFARAFKNHFFMNAMQYRQLGGSPKTIILKKTRIISQSLIQSMEVTIQTLPGYHVVYIANLGGYKIEKICDAWQKLFAWAQANHFVTPNSKMIGLSYDDPIITAIEKCRYYACITIPDTFARDTAIDYLDIPGGLHLVAQLTCEANQIQDAYQYLYSTWMPNSGFEPADSPPFDIYHATPEMSENGKFIMDICIPLRNL